MSLTELSIKGAKGKDKSYELYGERGLFLLVTPTDARLWRFKRKHDGVEKLISLGIYPGVKLKGARAHAPKGSQSYAAITDPARVGQLLCAIDG